jgi:hypothetical protein
MRPQYAIQLFSVIFKKCYVCGAISAFPSSESYLAPTTAVIIEATDLSMDLSPLLQLLNVKIFIFDVSTSINELDSSHCHSYFSL